MIFAFYLLSAGVASLVNLVINGDISMPNAGIFLPPPSSILKQTSDYGTVNGEVTGKSAELLLAVDR